MAINHIPIMADHRDVHPIRFSWVLCMCIPIVSVCMSIGWTVAVLLAGVLVADKQKKKGRGRDSFWVFCSQLSTKGSIPTKGEVRECTVCSRD